jgi:hypothetical protein
VCDGADIGLYRGLLVDTRKGVANKAQWWQGRAGQSRDSGQPEHMHSRVRAYLFWNLPPFLVYQIPPSSPYPLQGQGCLHAGRIPKRPGEGVGGVRATGPPPLPLSLGGLEETEKENANPPTALTTQTKRHGLWGRRGEPSTAPDQDAIPF